MQIEHPDLAISWLDLIPWNLGQNVHFRIEKRQALPHFIFIKEMCKYKRLKPLRGHLYKSRDRFAK